MILAWKTQLKKSSLTRVPKMDLSHSVVYNIMTAPETLALSTHIIERMTHNIT